VQLHVTDHVGVTTVEVSETRGTTALVYLQLHSSLYTGTVHVQSSVAGDPTGLTADQGCRQVSTGLPPRLHIHLYFAATMMIEHLLCSGHLPASSGLT
jgi:hypothetical protein